MALSRKPGAAIRQHRRHVRSGAEIAAARSWREIVTRGGCEMCRYVDLGEIPAEHRPDLRRIEGHHIIEQQQLKKHGKGDMLWDVRNGMGLCSYHHQRHTNWRERVPRRLLLPEAYEFAEEAKLSWLLDQYV